MARNQRQSSSAWQEIISAQESSGMDIKAFCEAKSIGIASFYQWRRRLRHRPEPAGAEGQKEGFIEVGRLDPGAIDQNGDGVPWQVTLELGGGINLILRRG